MHVKCLILNPVFCFFFLFGRKQLINDQYTLHLFIYAPISLKHFWGAILQRATEVVEDLLGSHQSRRAEIYQPNVETFVYDDVLIFYVAVKNVLRPEIEDSSYKLGREGFNKQTLQFNAKHLPRAFLLQLSSTHLSEDVARQRLIQPWLHVDEFKQVQSVSVLLHHQLEVAPVFKHLQHLMEYCVRHTQRHI